VKKLTRNAVVLQQGQQEIALDVPDTVRMKLNVKEKVKKNKTEHQLKITLAWTEGGYGQWQGDAGVAPGRLQNVPSKKVGPRFLHSICEGKKSERTSSRTIRGALVLFCTARGHCR
jgi:amphi-Trp domain-containing protein